MANLLSKTLFSLSFMVRAALSPVSFGVLAVVEQDGKVVLVRHSYTSGWKFPGGGVKRGEPPAEALLRELREEIGLTRSAAPELSGIYSRRIFPVTNIIALYRVRDAAFAFTPNLEIRAVMLADPAAPPPGASPAVCRRLAELTGQTPPVSYW
ncbi:MAG: NUDIX domain-containing protein [Alphaproteobacteria bacterium]|nr:NUDIX domain-containing protein [Alphaproteobacteria bacterium]MDE2109990.1 NUDIX domain-containing protein [Alphaproteobacteria bacterium]MDE2495153.1 NUDIX domain-containing protein [Alphaproteobacteria bacterium]